MATVLDTDAFLVNRGGTDYKVPYSRVKAGTGMVDSDVFLVNRGGTDYKATFANVRNGVGVLDTDLLLINRSGVDYQVPYSVVKAGFGPQPINPAPGDWTFAPGIVSGAGTQADPYVVTPATVLAAGGSAASAQLMTLKGLKAGDLVLWTDNSSGAGIRFKQADGVVPPSGQVDLHLTYLDTPASTAGATFTGDLKLGTTYFRWAVTQKVLVSFTWDATPDTYVRNDIGARSLEVQSKMRRCLVSADGSSITYLDADNSTKLAGPWLRLVETTLLDVPMTGTHQAEQANAGLRAGAPAWAAGTYAKGSVVSYGGQVWECVAASTTATPAAGTVAADLGGGAGQVMVEIPLFSIRHMTQASGARLRHEFAVALGEVTANGFSVHPAFIRPDGSYRSRLYFGTYPGGGPSGIDSYSGTPYSININRQGYRDRGAAKGRGWHHMGYWDLNAIQWLCITEYEDMHSRRAVGNGATNYWDATPTANGPSNVRGNRTGQIHTANGDAPDYVSYRGVENLWGRIYQWVGGCNIANGLDAYLSNNPANWADATTTNYEYAGTIGGNSGGGVIMDVMAGAALLPTVAGGTNYSTYLGSGSKTNQQQGGWTAGLAGGNIYENDRAGLFQLDMDISATFASNASNGRLVYSPLVPLVVDVLVLAGGGAGGHGGSESSSYGMGGGGAGGLLLATSLTISSSSSVIVGGGGAGGYSPIGAPGENSSFGSYTAIGGGGGGCDFGNSPGRVPGGPGGSGGGASAGWQGTSRAGGSGTAGQGNSGGYGLTASGCGGGYSGVGGSDGGGAGGAGYNLINFTGNLNLGVAGGGGGSGQPGSDGGGSGGTWMNDNGYDPDVNLDVYYGDVNTGGGGGGSDEGPGGYGGSGRVIVRYQGSTPRATGGTISYGTIGGTSYVIHDFTATGTFTPT